MNNNTENPFLDTIKHILDEQVSMIYTVQGEMKSDMTAMKDMQKDNVFQMSEMEDKIHALKEAVGMSFDNLSPPPRNRNAPNTYIEKRQNILNKKKHGQTLDPADMPSASRCSTPFGEGGTLFQNQDMTLQSGELLVDLMKLQNILNFEFLK